MLALASYLLFVAVIGIAMRLACGGRTRDNAAAAMLGASTRLF